MCNDNSTVFLFATFRKSRNFAAVKASDISIATGMNKEKLSAKH